MVLPKSIEELMLKPVEIVGEWFANVEVAILEGFASLGESLLEQFSILAIEGVTVFAVCYLVYCSYRVMCSSKDEVFSEFINKGMIAALAYYFAKVGGKIVLHTWGLI